MRSVADSAAQSLAELVMGRMAALAMEPTGRELARRTGIGKDTALAILSGRRPSPTEPTLRRLADGLSLSIQVLRQSAGRPRGERTPFVVPESWHGLSLAHRELLYRMAGALLQTGEPESVVLDTIGGFTPTRSHRNRFAARHDHSNSPQVNPVFDDGQ